jgi:hypothetical protein
VRALEVQGWRVFWDRTIPIGESWLDHIGVRLDAAAAVVVVWSRDSVKSEFVYSEASHARQRRALVPVTIDPVKPPLGLDAVQAADLVGWLRAGGVSPLPPPLVEAIRQRVPAKSRSASTPDAPTAALEAPAARPLRQVPEKPQTPVAKPATDRPMPRRRWLGSALGVVAIAAGGVALAIFSLGPQWKTNPFEAVPPAIVLSNTQATLEILSSGDWFVKILSDIDVYGPDENSVRSIQVFVTFRDSGRVQLREQQFGLSKALLGKSRHTKQRFQLDIRDVSKRALSADVWVEIMTATQSLRSAPVNAILRKPSEQ